MPKDKELLQPIPKVAQGITGKRPGGTTVWRWLRKGCRGAKLKAVMLGGQWLCTESDFRQFIDDQTSAQLAKHPGGGVSDEDLREAGLLQ